MTSPVPNTANPLIAPDIQAFIKEHEAADPVTLALKKAPAKMPAALYKKVVTQIKARQKARRKAPQWFENDAALLLPEPDIIEQASSTATALYKASLTHGKQAMDLTGGAGIDAWAISQNFENIHIIDKDAETAAALAHNLKALRGPSVTVSCQSAEDCLKTMAPCDLLMLDPQRRDQHKKGKFRLEDCSPDVLTLLPVLRQKAKTILLKTSPMLDIKEALQQLDAVNEVHIVEYERECKELLFVMTQEKTGEPSIRAVSIDADGRPKFNLTLTLGEEEESIAALSEPQKYLYEPGPAFLKSGAFNIMATRYGLNKLHPQTHLYTSEKKCADFPGRIFEIKGRYPVKAGVLPVQKANIAVRNLPLSAPDLQKKLKIKDGGDDFIFGCTLKNGEKAVLLCNK